MRILGVTALVRPRQESGIPDPWAPTGCPGVTAYDLPHSELPAAPARYGTGWFIDDRDRLLEEVTR